MDPGNMESCPVCGALVKKQNFKEHVKRVHQTNATGSKPLRPPLRHSMSRVRHGHRKLYLVVGILLVGIILGGWLLSSGQSNSSLVGHFAPEFSLQDPEKGTVTQSTFLGKPLFIFFTATYCVPCQVGAQQLARYDNETGGNAFRVLIVFIDESESNQQILNWRQQYGRTDWYVAKGATMAQAYKVQYLDTKYVFDKNGIVRWFDLNPLEYSTAKAVLGPLL
jgi:thiol-disulfide isomerase/thioredoxin